MPTNVELKAKLKDYKRAISIAEDLCGPDVKILTQEDIFFNVSTGRLKLRKVQDDSVVHSELIYYNRPDIADIKPSDYTICPVTNHQSLLHLLEVALGKRGSVKKIRLLYLFGQTRIHIDQVEGLGDFLEFEVVLNTNQNQKEGEKEAKKLMQKFEISEEDLIEEAYIDLILKK